MAPKTIIRMLLATAVVVGIARGASAQGPKPPGAETSTQTPGVAALQRRDAKIGPHDVVQVTVLPPAAGAIFDNKYPVGIDGTFSFPRLGRITAGGLTVSELETELTKQLKGPWVVNPQVTVVLDQAKTKQVSVAGAVRSIGIYPYANEIYVFDALIMAAGVTDAAGEEATVLRANSNNRIKVDLVGILAGDRSKDIILQDGDTVIVSSAVPVTIQGFVTSPGPYVIRRGMTVQQAIGLAGGVSKAGRTNGKGIKILRPTGDSTKKPTEIEVQDWTIEVVKPGDTIVVPRARA